MFPKPCVGLFHSRYQVPAEQPAPEMSPGAIKKHKQGICRTAVAKSFTLVAQAGVQWCDLSSPQPPGSRDSPASASRQRWGFSMLARLVSNSQPQVIRPPRPLKVLGLQAVATTPGQVYFKAGAVVSPMTEVLQGSTAFQVCEGRVLTWLHSLFLLGPCLLTAGASVTSLFGGLTLQWLLGPEV
ncbi:hypothetical protein AAY473_011225 [Plecturocebus cupreus]